MTLAPIAAWQRLLVSFLNHSANFFQASDAKFMLLNAILQSHGARHKDIVRAIAYACIKYGFDDFYKGYILRPVSVREVENFLKAQCPQRVQQQELSNVLRLPQCNKYFTVLKGPPSSQPHVIISDLPSMISQPHLHQLQSLLDNIQHIALHPMDMAVTNQTLFDVCPGPCHMSTRSFCVLHCLDLPPQRLQEQPWQGL